MHLSLLSFYQFPLSLSLFPSTNTLVPGSVLNVQTLNTSDTSLKVSWGTPLSGGRPETYRVRVVKIATGDVVERETDNLFVTVPELGKSCQ